MQVLAALVLGVAAPCFAIELKLLSDGFLKLISMIVAPIVFCVVVHGIAGAGDLKKVGRVGGKALCYFEVMTTVALILGLALALVGNCVAAVVIAAWEGDLDRTKSMPCWTARLPSTRSPTDVKARTGRRSRRISGISGISGGRFRRLRRG